MDERLSGDPLEVAIGRTVGRARIYDFALKVDLMIHRIFN